VAGHRSTLKVSDGYRIGHERVRSEYHGHVEEQGIAAAQIVLGQRVPGAPVPSCWSEQHDLHLEPTGYDHRWDEVAASCHGIACQGSRRCVEKGDEHMTQIDIAELWEWAEYY
jgi:hypothetical protein